MSSKNSSAPSAIAGIGMLSLSLMMMGTTVITPALSILAEHFAGQDVSFIQTLATLGVVVGTFVAGAIMGKYVKMKTLGIVGNILCIVFGVLPIMFDNYALLLVDRAVFGFSLGLINPLGNALIMKYYEGDKRSSMLGFGTMAMNIGGIAFQQLGGALAGIDWRLMFLAHLFFAVSLILCFFLPSEEKPSGKAAAAAAAGNNEKLNVKVIIILSFVTFLLMTANMSIMMKSSEMFLGKGIADVNLAALALTIYTIAGMVAGAIYGPVYKALKRYIVLVGFVCLAAGAAIILFGTNYFVMAAGFAINGVGFSWVFATMNDYVARTNPISKIGTAASTLVALMNIGGFVCSFWMMALGQDITAIYVADIVVCVVLAVFMLFYNPVKKAEAAQ